MVDEKYSNVVLLSYFPRFGSFPTKKNKQKEYKMVYDHPVFIATHPLTLSVMHFLEREKCRFELQHSASGLWI